MPAARSASLRSVVRTTGGVVLVISNLLGGPSGCPIARYDGRSPGSRVFAFGHLPGFPVVSWPSACRLQLRGEPRVGGAKNPLPHSLLIPVRGTVVRLIRAMAKPRQRDSAGRCPALLAGA